MKSSPPTICPIHTKPSRRGENYRKEGRGARSTQSRSITTANPSGLRIGAARILIPHREHPHSSTIAALVQACRRSLSLIQPATCGNVWVADQRSANERELAKFPEEKGKGHIVVKFSPDGKVLLTIGKQGVAGDPPDALTQPTSMAIAPNGDVFISEGHNQSAQAPPETVSRISKFTPDGKFIKSFGKLGSGPGEFRGPHDIAMDAQGRLFVADRGNMRIQILDQDGNYLGEWKQFSRPSGVYIRTT